MISAVRDNLRGRRQNPRSTFTASSATVGLIADLPFAEKGGCLDRARRLRSRSTARDVSIDSLTQAEPPDISTERELCSERLGLRGFLVCKKRATCNSRTGQRESSMCVSDVAGPHDIAVHLGMSRSKVEALLGRYWMAPDQNTRFGGAPNHTISL